MKPKIDIVLDAGHGGHDSGAVNALTGSREKDVVLADCLALAAELRSRGVSVALTRETDVYLTLRKRAAVANNYKAPLISLHCNASNSVGHGFEAFTSPGQTESDSLATVMLKAYGRAIDLTARYDLQDGDEDKEARFAVLTKTRGVAVLFELGFIDNVGDEKFLVSERMRALRVDVLAQNIVKWLVKHRGFKPVKIVAKVDLLSGGESLEEQLRGVRSTNESLRADIKAQNIDVVGLTEEVYLQRRINIQQLELINQQRSEIKELRAEAQIAARMIDAARKALA